MSSFKANTTTTPLLLRERDGREGCRWWARFVVFDYVVVVVIVVVLLLLLFCQIRFRLGASFDPFGIFGMNIWNKISRKLPHKSDASNLISFQCSRRLLWRVVHDLWTRMGRKRARYCPRLYRLPVGRRRRAARPRLQEASHRR